MQLQQPSAFLVIASATATIIKETTKVREATAAFASSVPVEARAVKAAIAVLAATAIMSDAFAVPVN